MRILLLSFVLLLVPSAPAQINSTWFGGPGNYTEAIHWSTDPVVPQNSGNTTFAVSVPGGTMTLNVDATVTSFALGTARLNVVGNRTLTAATTFLPGAILGAGTLRLAGTAAAGSSGPDAYLNLNGGATLVNLGAFTHARLGGGATALVLDANSTGTGAVIENRGTFLANAAAGEASIGFGADSAANRFTNAAGATFTKTGSADYAINVAFHNAGQTEVQAGALHLNRGGTSAGALTVFTGATVALSGNHVLQAGATVGDGGTVRLKSGSLAVQSGAEFAAGTLEIQSGTATVHAGGILGESTRLIMNGGTAQVDVAHTFLAPAFADGGAVTGAAEITFADATFAGGSYVFGGAGRKSFAGAATFATGVVSQYLNVNGGGAEVRNTGTFTQRRNGPGENAIILNADQTGGGSVFRNAATFLADANGGDLSVGRAAAHAGNGFVNEGLFTKTGAGAYDFNVALTNSGTIDVQVGTVRANFGGVSTGTYAVASGTTFALTGAHVIADGAGVTGAGTLRVNGGTTTFESGASMNAATLHLAGGTTALRAGSILGATALTVGGGTLELDIAHTFTGAQFSGGGAVTGSGAATFAGATTFDGSSYTFGGSGEKRFAGTVALTSGGANQFFNVNAGTTVVNAGAFTHARPASGTSALVLNADLGAGSSVFRNAAGATFTANMTGGAGEITAGQAASGVRFENAGALVKTGSHEYAVNVAFANTGAVSIQQGTLALNVGDGGATAGSFLVLNNAIFAANGGLTVGSGTTVTGAGRFQARGGATTFLSGASLAVAAVEVQAGTLAFRSGSSLGLTALTLQGGTLEMDIAHTFTNATFGNGASVTGAGAVNFAGTANLSNRTLSLGGVGNKTFTGTTTLAATTGNAFLNLRGGATAVNAGNFTQSGAGSGVVLAADGTGAATFRNAASANFTAAITSGVAQLGYGSATPGGNRFENNGTFTKTGAGAHQVNVPLINAGTVVVSGGTLFVTAGMSGAGATRIDAGATLDLSENANPSTIGTLVHQNATLALGANALTVTQDYDNAQFGSGNAFNARANVSGTAAILAGGNTALAYTGDATGGGVHFGTVHVGDTVTRAFALQNTGTAATVRGAVQTAAGGGAITDSRLSGNGVTAENFRLDAGQTLADRTITFSATTAGALRDQQLNVATNFANVTLNDLAITGAANFYAAPEWTDATGASLMRLDATRYVLSFGSIDPQTGLVQASLSLLNALADAVFQDALGGSFVTTGITHFQPAGFAPVSGITPGDERDDFTISLDPAVTGPGSFADTLTFLPTSTNDSGTWNLSPIELTLQATVIPEPTVLALLTAGTALALARRRYRG